MPECEPGSPDFPRPVSHLHGGDNDAATSDTTVEPVSWPGALRTAGAQPRYRHDPGGVSAVPFLRQACSDRCVAGGKNTEKSCVL